MIKQSGITISNDREDTISKKMRESFGSLFRKIIFEVGEGDEDSGWS